MSFLGVVRNNVGFEKHLQSDQAGVRNTIIEHRGQGQDYFPLKLVGWISGLSG